MFSNEIGKDMSTNDSQDTPIIILVEPQLPENIGMVARAMANFGLKDLRLVTPIAEFPSDKAYSTASKADHILNDAKVFDNFADAVSDINYLYAATARQRSSFKEVKSPSTLGKELRLKIKEGQKVAILLGRERFGLSNEEVSLSDAIVTFPVDPNFSSLNIAQAALLVAYEWQTAGLEQKDQPLFSVPEQKVAPKDSLFGFLNQLENALQARGYFRPLARKEVMCHHIRDVITRAQFSKSEIDLLRGVIASLEKYSPTHPTGTVTPHKSLISKNIPEISEENN